MNNFLTFEDELEYLADFVENSTNKKDWKIAINKLNANIHYDSLRKAFDTTKYSGYNVMQYYKNKSTKYLADEEINKIENLKDELYKQRVKTQDVLREKKNILREEARFETLLDVLKEKIDDLETIKLNDFKEFKNKDIIWAVSQFSDWHALKLIDNQWNFYNKDTLKYRANTLVDKIISKSKLHNVTNLVIEINGDMIDGLIQVSSRNSAEADCIQQILFVSELLSQCINKLIPYYQEVKVITTLGNHGRLTSSKKDCLTKENFEMLIPEFLKLRLDNKVKIIRSQGLDFVGYRIEDKFICCSHGQNDKLKDVISDFAKIYKKVPTEVHLGHTHSYQDINDCDIMVTVNGSLVGTDDYAISLRKINKPSQNLIVYDNDRCIYNLIV
jgi:hypothetical protein